MPEEEVRLPPVFSRSQIAGSSQRREPVLGRCSAAPLGIIGCPIPFDVPPGVVPGLNSLCGGNGLAQVGCTQVRPDQSPRQLRIHVCVLMQCHSKILPRSGAVHPSRPRASQIPMDCTRASRPQDRTSSATRETSLGRAVDSLLPLRSESPPAVTRTPQIRYGLDTVQGGVAIRPHRPMTAPRRARPRDDEDRRPPRGDPTGRSHRPAPVRSRRPGSTARPPSGHGRRRSRRRGPCLR